MKNGIFFRKITPLVLAAGIIAASGIFFDGNSIETEAAGTYDINLDDTLYAYVDGSVIEKASDNAILVMYPEYTTSGISLIVREIDMRGQTLSNRSVSLPGTLWGGCIYRDTDGYRYVATGRGERNKKEARWYFTKLSPEFSVSGTLRISGKDSYTFWPFDAGNCSMASCGNYLYVHASRKMPNYHQSNVTFIIDKRTMTFVNKRTDYGFDYVSHSFNQLIRNDDDRLIEVDHGDSFPRSVILKSWKEKGDGSVPVSDQISTLTLLKIKGRGGDNFTGVMLGGLETGRNHDIVSGVSVHHDRMTDDEFNTNRSYIADPHSGANTYANKDVFVSLIDKDMGKSRLLWLSDYGSRYKRYDLTNQKLVKINDDRFALIYGLKYSSDDGYLLDDQYDYEMGYFIIDSDGNIISHKDIDEFFACNSEPVALGNQVVWMYTSRHSNYGMCNCMQTLNLDTGKLETRNIDPLGNTGIEGVEFDKKLTYDTVTTGPNNAMPLVDLTNGGKLKPGKRYIITGTGEFKGYKDTTDNFVVVSSSNTKVIDIQKPINFINSYDKNTKKGYTFGSADIVITTKQAGVSTLTLTIGDKTCRTKYYVEDASYKTDFKKVDDKIKGKNRTLHLTWSKVKGVDGYNIQLVDSSSKEKKKNVYVAGNVTEKTFKKLSTKFDSVRIRTYRVTNGKKAFSKWSRFRKIFTD